MHGDIGKCHVNDAIIFLSKSGVTEEIIKMFPYLPMPTENWIALVGNVQSEIAKKCAIQLDCSVEKEACLNNLAPTTSTTVAIAMGDAMAVLFESFVGLSKEHFARNHPGGLLGKSLSLKVESIMIPLENSATCSLDTTMKEVILLMTRYPTGICSVIDDGHKLQGIVVEGDIRRHLVGDQDFLSWPVSKVMNKSPKFLNTKSLALDAIKLMEEKNKMVYVLPVLDDDHRMKGVLRLHDLVREGFSLRD
jgi:arabinose-5-phosphate isomerase